MLPGRVFVSLLVVLLLLLQLALVSAAALQEPVVLRSADSVWGVTLEVRSARFDRDGVAFNTRLFCHATHAHTRGPTERCWSCPRAGVGAAPPCRHIRATSHVSVSSASYCFTVAVWVRVWVRMRVRRCVIFVHLPRSDHRGEAG